MYTCNGKEENFTQCNRSNPTSFLCNEVGKVICEGIIHAHVHVYILYIYIHANMFVHVLKLSMHDKKLFSMQLVIDYIHILN